MPTLKRFEDLRCWQFSRELVNMVYEATNRAPFRNDFGLRDQIRRAAVSVMSNIAEGFTAATDGEFMRFLSFSRRSISEVQSQIYVALDQSYIPKDIFDKIFNKARETEKQTNALISYLNKSRHATMEDQGSYGAPSQDVSDITDMSEL